jgi:hypothetical protein
MERNDTTKRKTKEQCKEGTREVTNKTAGQQGSKKISDHETVVVNRTGGGVELFMAIKCRCWSSGWLRQVPPKSS